MRVPISWGVRDMNWTLDDDGERKDEKQMQVLPYASIVLHQREYSAQSNSPVAVLMNLPS